MSTPIQEQRRFIILSIIALIDVFAGTAAAQTLPSVPGKVATKDGTRFEIHAYINSVTGKLVEPKSILVKVTK